MFINLLIFLQYLILLFFYLMMNSKILLAKKRNRTWTKVCPGHDELKNSDSPMLTVNGYNIVELYYAESLENKNLSNDDEFPENNIIELREESPKEPKISENNPEVIDMTRTKVKSIEEYYSSKFGITEIKENCFKCLMTNFMSNELLYFNSKKDLFNYIKYCLAIKNKIIFINEDTLKTNKENFLNSNTSFLNGWRFFIPKTICKGCFMEIINMKYLITKIKNIFSDTERDSLCRTNYRNYALFSPRFRAAFRLNKLKSSRIRSRSVGIRSNKKKSNDENNYDTNKNKKEEKNYNSCVKYDEKKNIIIIDKKIIDKSLLEIIKNKTFLNEKYINNKYKNNLNENEVNIFNNKNNINLNLINSTNSNLNKEESINNKNNNILFQGQNNINIINNISINNNTSKGNTYINFDAVNRQIKELLNEMDSRFNGYFSCLEKIIYIIRIIDNYTNLCKEKLFYYIFLYDLSKYNEILKLYENFYKYYEENLNLLNHYIIISKNSIDKTDKFLNGILYEIKDNNDINIKDKKSLITVIQELKYYINENNNALDKSTYPIQFFNYYYLFLYKLVKEMQPSQ